MACRLTVKLIGAPLMLALGAVAMVGSAAAQVSVHGSTVPRFEIELEAGAVWASRNDVQIPNESGTRFSLTDLAGSGPDLAYRVAATWNVGRRHALRLLVAPLTITGAAALDAPVLFANQSFAPGVGTEADYRFNSYRLTYRYRLYDGATWSWAAGFTAKVRDAKVELRQPGVAARDVDLGFVPLLHLAASARIGDRWSVGGELDALAAPQGRAEDLALKLSYAPSPRWSVAAGYRTLEGGADVDAVYTFAWLHYAVVSFTYRR